MDDIDIEEEREFEVIELLPDCTTLDTNQHRNQPNKVVINASTRLTR
jgi:hypothetical protein